MINFVLVIDGEAALNVQFPDPSILEGEKKDYFEKMIAVFSSDPMVVKHARVDEGAIWDGITFKNKSE